MGEKLEVKETDKPFVLALVSSGITVLNILLMAVGALTKNDQMVSTCVETLKFTFPLTTLAWTYYFSKETK
jgi:hypothetical protein